MHTARVLMMAITFGAIAVRDVPAEAGSQRSWQPPAIGLPQRANGPLIACTPAELHRLREAWRSPGPAHDVVQARIDRAAAQLRSELEFPPRGGQHNQWYQCEACQLGLETVSDTEHRCPRCKTVYSGEPYDDVIYSRKHAGNVSQALDCAWAYALTGEPRFAERTRAILAGYADRYRSYPYHDSRRREDPAASGGHIEEQTLDEASMMARYIAPAFDLVDDSDVLSDTDRRHIRENLILPMLENLGKHRAGKGNWQTWHNAAMVCGGAVLGDRTWIERAVLEDGNGFVHQMQVSVTEEGMWYENSWGYHFYTLSAMIEILEGTRRLGIDLWSHPRLKRMFTLPIQYTMPDGSLPRFGDDVHSTMKGKDAWYEPAYHAYGEESMHAMLPNRTTWLSIMYGRRGGTPEVAPDLPGSTLFPSAGHAILRTQGDAGLAAALTFGPYGGFHGHLDKLSFVFFGYERELGVDPGRARSQAYRLPIHTQWYKATVGHNAVLVDQQSQEPAAGRLLLFEADEQYALAMAACSDAYPGVTQKRLLALTPEYLLVLDQFTSDREHDYTWIYHNEGKRARCDRVRTPIDLTGVTDGRGYLQNTLRDAVASPAGVAFEADALQTRLLLAWPGEGVLMTGDGPKASVLDRVPVAMLETRGQDMWFVALVEPVPSGKESYALEIQARPSGGEAFQIQVRHAAGRDRVEVTSDGVKMRRNDRIQLDGHKSSPRG